MLNFNNFEELVLSWNKTLAVVAKIASVPVALVMRIDKENISVFSRNENINNPYNIGDFECLNGSGLYCEHVIKTQQLLNIPNALNDSLWDHNPDLKLNMIAYLGLPIVDSENEPFGTVCILDTKEHVFSETTIELLATIKQSFEVQLQQIHQQHIKEEKRQLEELAMLIKGVSHEINTPLGLGIITTSIIDSNIDSIQQKLNSKSLNQKALTHNLTIIQDSVKLLTKSLNKAADNVSTLQELICSETMIDDAFQQYQLYPLVKMVFDKLTSEFSKHNIHAGISVSNSTDTQAFIAADLLQQVIEVLCKNSLEHGFTGIDNPKIYIEFEQTINSIKLHYQDNGSGIDSTDYSKIFTPFYTTNRAIGCNGIGLSIVKRIITQQLHGNIAITDTDVGVHFIISLPKTADSIIDD